MTCAARQPGYIANPCSGGHHAVVVKHKLAAGGGCEKALIEMCDEHMAQYHTTSLVLLMYGLMGCPCKRCGNTPTQITDIYEVA